MFHSIVRQFLNNELGQDLAEYCLLIPLLLLIGLGIFIQVSGGIQMVWGNASTTLNASSRAQTSPVQPDGR